MTLPSWRKTDTKKGFFEVVSQFDFLCALKLVRWYCPPALSPVQFLSPSPSPSDLQRVARCALRWWRRCNLQPT